MNSSSKIKQQNWLHHATDLPEGYRFEIPTGLPIIQLKLFAEDRKPDKH